MLRQILGRENDPDGDHKLNHAWRRHKYASLELSRRKFILSPHRSSVAWLDLDHVEHRYLLSCAADASLAIIDTQQIALPPHTTPRPSPTPTHRPIATITKQSNIPSQHKVAITCAMWYPIDNGIFITGARDGQVLVWDANALAVAGVFSLGTRATTGASSTITSAPIPVHAMAMSPISSSHCLIAVGSDESDVLLCDIQSGGFSHRLSGHRAPVWGLAWSVTNEWELSTGGRDGQIRVWDVRRAGTRAILDMNATKTRSLVHTGSQFPPPPPPQQGLHGNNNHVRSHDGGITGLIPSPDGLFLISAGNDDRIRLWDGKRRRHELIHYNNTYNRANKPRQLGISDDGEVLFHPSGSAVQVFHVTRGGDAVTTLTGGHFETINACCWNGVQEELYTAGNDHTIVVWDTASSHSGRGAVGGGGGGGDDDDDADAWSD